MDLSPTFRHWAYSIVITRFFICCFALWHVKKSKKDTSVFELKLSWDCSNLAKKKKCSLLYGLPLLHKIKYLKLESFGIDRHMP